MVGDAIEGRSALAGLGHQGYAHQNILVTATITAELQPNYIRTTDADIWIAERIELSKPTALAGLIRSTKTRAIPC